MKLLRHTVALLAAAALTGAVVASGVSCRAVVRGATDRNAVLAAPSADTVALIEGMRLFGEGEYNLARGQLTLSARSASTYIRAESFLYLNALEMELGNYDQARPWLEKYHLETVQLLQRAAEASLRMSEQAARLRRRHDVLMGAMVVLGMLVVGAGAVFLRRPHPAVKSDDNNSAEALPAHNLEIEAWPVDAEAFKQTPIWTEIAGLAVQRPGRDARVLSLAGREVLDGELARHFAEFAALLQRDYPALTAGDVKLCCLSLLPLSPFGRALCFGSTETNIVKQRKHTIKKKLAGTPRSRALFEFIFRSRDGL